jgi:hypothetical protein
MPPDAAATIFLRLSRHHFISLPDYAAAISIILFASAAFARLMRHAQRADADVAASRKDAHTHARLRTRGARRARRHAYAYALAPRVADAHISPKILRFHFRHYYDFLRHELFHSSDIAAAIFATLLSASYALPFSFLSPSPLRRPC